MPKRKVQKIKKKKKKSSNTAQNQKCNISIPILASPDRIDNIVIEAKSKDNVLFVIKNKQSYFKADTAKQLLLHLENKRNRWDLICNIVSWCMSYNDHFINNNTSFWNKYVQSKNKSTKSIPKQIVPIIINRINDLYSQCIQQSHYYYKDFGKNTRFDVKLADFEIELLTIGYLKKYAKNMNNYDIIYIATDILSLFAKYIGYVSNFVFDTDNKILFTSTDSQQRRKQKSGKDGSAFACYDKYAIYKTGFEIKSRGRMREMVHFKVLEFDQLFAIGFGIYDENMSDNLKSNQWMKQKDEYLKINSNNFRQRKWQINDIISIVMDFGQIDVNEYMTKWILSVTIYKNGHFLVKNTVIAGPVYIKDGAFDNCVKKLHIIFDNDPSKYKVNANKIQLLESIDASLMERIDWKNSLKKLSRIWYCLDERKVLKLVTNIYDIDENKDNDLLILKDSNWYHDELSIEVNRNCLKILAPYSYSYRSRKNDSCYVHTIENNPFSKFWRYAAIL